MGAGVVEQHILLGGVAPGDPRYYTRVAFGHGHSFIIGSSLKQMAVDLL
jgi:hypothetical protein